MIIFSKKILSAYKNHQMLNYQTGKYPAGESYVKLPYYSSEIKSAAIYCSIISNDDLIEILLVAENIKHHFQRIVLLCPYLAYGRQDKDNKQELPAIRLIAKLLKSAGIDTIVTLDMHSNMARDYFMGNLIHIDIDKIFSKEVISSSFDYVVSPDLGSSNRAKILSESLGIEMIRLRKTRTSETIFTTLDDKSITLKGKNCLLVDDILDSGGTLISAANTLKDQGALNISALITHALLSGSAAEKIQKNANIDNINVTDSIFHENLPSKFKSISIENLLIHQLELI